MTDARMDGEGRSEETEGGKLRSLVHLLLASPLNTPFINLHTVTELARSIRSST